MEGGGAELVDVEFTAWGHWCAGLVPLQSALRRSALAQDRVEAPQTRKLLGLQVPLIFGWGATEEKEEEKERAAEASELKELL